MEAAGPIVFIGHGDGDGDGDGGARGKEAPSMCQGGNACRRSNAPIDATGCGSAAITIVVTQTGGSTFAQTAQGCEAFVPEKSTQ